MEYIKYAGNNKEKVSKAIDVRTQVFYRLKPLFTQLLHSLYLYNSCVYFITYN